MSLTDACLLEHKSHVTVEWAICLAMLVGKSIHLDVAIVTEGQQGLGNIFGSSGSSERGYRRTSASQITEIDDLDQI
jgi:hypothetical protein